jgi:hypothetical protein
VVSDAFWRNHLSAAQDAVGKVVSIDGRPHTIVGVLPPEFGQGIFRELDAVRPIVLGPRTQPPRRSRLFVTARLKPGVALEQAPGRPATIAAHLQTDFPITNARTGVVVRPLLELLGANINAVVYLLSLVASSCSASRARTSRASSSRMPHRGGASLPSARPLERDAPARSASS